MDEDLITKEQLEELMKKADELNEFIKRMTKKNRLADYTKLRPLDKPRNMEDDVPVFGFTKLFNTDAWNCFCKLAKLLHENSNEFYMGTAIYYKKHIHSISVPSVKKFEDFTREQMELSGQMIDEMIAIYNKYYIATHKKVVYNPEDGTGKRSVPVLPPTDVKYTGVEYE